MTPISRFLMAGGGGGGFDTRTLRSITSSPDGGYTQIPDPKAFYYNGATYFVVAPDTGSTSDVVVGKYDHATQTVTTHVLASGFESPPDNHSSGSVIVRESDHRLVVAASHHAEVTAPYVWISTNPEDISAFGSAIRPSSIGAAQYTYMVLYQMADETLYLFYRDYISGTTTGRLAYSTSTDGGATWAARTVIYTGATGKVPYWRIATDWVSRIDVFTTDDVPTISQLGHMYLDTTTDKWYTTAGVEITASRPFGFSAITSVHSAIVWSWGACLDSLGRPATVMMQDIGSDNAILVARWRSGAWHTDTVVASVGGQLTGNQYASGCGIHHTNPDIVYVAKKATKWEMWRYVSLDDGATWTGSQLTTGSSDDQVWADVVHKAGTGLEGMWLHGNYTSDTDYAFGVTGYG